MINITLTKQDDGELHSCKVEGHAGYAKNGEDVVCAAVSILVRVAVLQLQEWKKSSESFKVSLDCKQRGLVEFSVMQFDGQLSKGLAHLFDFLKLGFESIACEYPSYVKFKVS